MVQRNGTIFLSIAVENYYFLWESSTSKSSYMNKRKKKYCPEEGWDNSLQRLWNHWKVGPISLVGVGKGEGGGGKGPREVGIQH